MLISQAVQAVARQERAAVLARELHASEFDAVRGDAEAPPQRLRIQAITI